MRHSDWLWLCGVTMLGFAGCSTAPDPVADAATSEQLEAIYSAYRAANEALNRAPTKPEELASHLPEGTDAAKLYDPFVIIWGTPIVGATTADQASAEPLIFGYSKESQDGVRIVATTHGVWQMLEEEFQKGRFPEGHKP